MEVKPIAVPKRLEFDRLSQFPPPKQRISDEVIEIDDEDEEEDSTEELGTETISVHLRLRPTECQEKCYRLENNVIIAKITDTVSAHNPNKDISEKHFTFNSIMDETVDQRSVYESCVRPILSEAFSEKGATFLSYGTSSSGKTYTILGDQNPGIVIRAITQIFNEFGLFAQEIPCVKVENDNIQLLSDIEIEDEFSKLRGIIAENRQLKKQKKMSLKTPPFEQIQTEHSFEMKMLEQEPLIWIWVSFIEIYNEKIIDLLDSNRSTMRQLRIISNDGNSYVKGMTSIYVKSMAEAYEVLQFGLQRVKYSATGINANSSRSHSIFFITMISSKDNMDFEWATYKFCDLAGAERTKKTGNVGDRLKEAGVINSSLLVLGRCLEIVHQNQKNRKHQELVPVRESKLTFLLQSSLQGKERFMMIVNLLPSLEFFEENLNVLNFAAIAKQIVVKKATIRKATSHRYSLLMKHAIDSPRKTANGSGINGSVIREHSLDYTDESSLGSEYMSEFELREELKRKTLEAELYKNEIIRLTVEFNNTERNIKDNLNKQQMESEQRLREFHERELQIKVHYYERKMEHQAMCKDRVIKHLEEDVDDLQTENEELQEEVDKLETKIEMLEAKIARKIFGLRRKSC